MNPIDCDLGAIECTSNLYGAATVACGMRHQGDDGFAVSRVGVVLAILMFVPLASIKSHCEELSDEAIQALYAGTRQTLTSAYTLVRCLTKNPVRFVLLLP